MEKVTPTSVSPTLMLQRHGLVDASFGGTQDVEEYAAPVLDAQIAEYTRLIDDANEAMSIINNDRGLNAAGKNTRINAVKQKALEGLDQMAAARRRRFDQDLEKAQAEIPVKLPTPAADDTASVIKDELQLQELRQHLNGMTSADRISAVFLAAEQDDVQLLRAVDGAPRVMEIVHSDTIAQAKERYIQRKFPDQLQQVQTIKMSLALYEQNITVARQALRTLTGVVAKKQDASRLVITSDTV